VPPAAGGLADGAELRRGAGKGGAEPIDPAARGDAVLVAAVVSDWLMPGTRGDDFLIALRKRWPQTGRVLLTGQADTAALDRARDEGGAHGVLAKPWTADELRVVLCGSMAA